MHKVRGQIHALIFPAVHKEPWRQCLVNGTSHPLLWQFCGWENDKSNFERKAGHRENPDDDDTPVGHTPDDLSRATKNLSEQSQVGVLSKQTSGEWKESAKISGPGLFWLGQTPKFKNAGSGVPWRKFWIGHHAPSTTAILSDFWGFQVVGKFPLAHRPQIFYSLFHSPAENEF